MACCEKWNTCFEIAKVVERFPLKLSSLINSHSKDYEFTKWSSGEGDVSHSARAGGGGKACIQNAMRNYFDHLVTCG